MASLGSFIGPVGEYNSKYGTNATSLYGNGIATHKDSLWVNGKPYQQLGLKDLGDAINYLGGYNGNTEVGNANIKSAKAWASILAPLYSQKKAEYDQSEYQRMMAEYQSQMNAYLEKMAEAMAAEEPAAEPLKAAAEVQSAARADTNRKQLLRRGLMSTLTRYGQGGQAQKLGA